MWSSPPHSVPAGPQFRRGRRSAIRRERRAAPNRTWIFLRSREAASGALFPQQMRAYLFFWRSLQQQPVVVRKICQLIGHRLTLQRIVQFWFSSGEDDLALIRVIFGVLASAHSLAVFGDLNDIDLAIADGMVEARIGIRVVVVEPCLQGQALHRESGPPEVRAARIKSGAVRVRINHMRRFHDREYRSSCGS